jgi:opacity protein-like surface antigen
MKFRAVSLAVATVALATPSFAADMPVKARAPAAAVCGNQFNGFYLGGNVGAVAYTATRTDIDGLFVDNSDFSANKIGATAGVQAGYDWQFCNKLFGVVADWNWSDAKANTQINPNGTIFSPTNDIGARLNWFSTVRARAGLVVDNALFYITGGLAIADVDSSYDRRLLTAFGPPPVTLTVANSFSQTRYGFAAGAGTEVLLGGNWTLNAEMLYLQFAQERQSLEVPVAIFGAPGTRQFDENDQAFVARVGLNYRFNGGASALATAQASMPTKGPVLAASVARFNGAYIGVNGATVSYTAMRHDQDSYIADNGQYSATRFGYSGGVQAGYDWQFGSRLFGIVGDINYSDTEATARQNPSAGGPGVTLVDQATSGKMSWYGTLRGRLGLVADDSLIYVTGGLAVADIETTVSNRVLPFTNETFSTSDTRWGWTAGVGTETALWGGWSLVSELLYMQFDKANDTFRSGPLVQNRNVGFESHDSAWVSKVGVNYRGNAFAAAGRSYAGPARFTGLYIGGNVGGVSYTALRHDADGFISDNGEYTATKIGVTAGGQIGYDWQFGNKVFGVVADANWADVSATSSQNITFAPPFGLTGDQSTSGKMNWFGTLRTRGGVAFNDVLVYGTGGLAVAGIDTTVSSTFVGFPAFSEQFSSSKTRWGWTGGMGAEFAFANNWSVTGEVLYMQFKEEHDTFRSRPTNQNRFVSFDSNDSAWVGKVGVNYRFNSAALLR